MAVYQIEKRDVGVKKILWGLVLQSVAIFLLGFTESNVLNGTIVVDILSALFLVVGYVFLFTGAAQFLQAKGHAYGWSILAIFSVIGISVILLLTMIQPHETEPELIPFSKDDFLSHHNVIELLLLFILAFPLLYIALVVGVYSGIAGINFFEVMDTLDTPESGMSALSGIASILAFGHFLLFLSRSFKKKGMPYSKIWGSLKQIQIGELGIVALIDFIFSISLGTVIVYGLSHLFPQSVENYLNESRITNLMSLGALAFGAIIMAPIVEELLFRGFILQKWSLKWGVRAGVIVSSLLFAICHFNFHIPALFIGSLLLSSVYLRTKNLMSPILLHCFYNSCVIAWASIDFFGKSALERTEMISITEYQSLVEPLLPQRFLLLAFCTPAIIYYLYKRFPKQNTSLPILNESR